MSSFIKKLLCNIAAEGGGDFRFHIYCCAHDCSLPLPKKLNAVFVTSLFSSVHAWN